MMELYTLLKMEKIVNMATRSQFLGKMLKFGIVEGGIKLKMNLLHF